METIKLWWIIRKQEDKTEYIKDSYENVFKMYENLEIYDYSVVHPKNENHPLKYRQENQEFIDYIEQQHQIQLQKLRNLNAPKIIQDYPDRVGQFAIYNTQFDTLEDI